MSNYLALLLALVCAVGVLLASKEYSCNSSESCEAHHFNNPLMRTIFQQRCEHKNFFTSTERNITYTHIPKAGGSSLNQVLKKFCKERFQRAVHEPFQVSALKMPSNLFVTVLREPRDRAISLYSYINQRDRMPNTTAQNEMWQQTFRTDPAVWSTSFPVLKRLREDVLMYFSPRLHHDVFKTETSAAVITRAESFLPPTPIAVSKDSFMHYTKAMPSHLRCTRHMEVAWILLRNYAAVGTTENLPRLLQLLQKRTQLNHPDFLRNATAVYRNRSNYRRVGAANVTILYNNLRDKFYCDTVLWKIADLMNERDLQC